MSVYTRGSFKLIKRISERVNMWVDVDRITPMRKEISVGIQIECVMGEERVCQQKLSKRDKHDV